jgi:Na+/melibiose symporter-like transporter
LVIQLSQAIGVSVAMTLIGMAGFVEQDLSPDAPKIVSQPVNAQSAIIYIMALTPLIFMTLGILVCLRYRLTSENHAKVVAALDGSDEEKAEVLKLL